VAEAIYYYHPCLSFSVLLKGPITTYHPLEKKTREGH